MTSQPYINNSNQHIFRPSPTHFKELINNQNMYHTSVLKEHIENQTIVNREISDKVRKNNLNLIDLATKHGNLHEQFELSITEQANRIKQLSSLVQENEQYLNSHLHGHDGKLHELQLKIGALQKASEEQDKINKNIYEDYQKVKSETEDKFKEQEKKLTPLYKFIEVQKKFNKKIFKRFKRLKKSDKEIREEQNDKMLPILDFIDKQKLLNTEVTDEYKGMKELQEELHLHYYNLEKEHLELVEKVLDQAKMYSQLIDNVENHEGLQRKFSEELLRHKEDDIELMEFIEEQKQVLNNLLDYLRQQEERYQILSGYIRNQENFNHKLFDYMCDQFERIETNTEEKTLSN
ncbi:hypothetical protein IMZ08_09375 [Bacillus luteolus]|uniref:Uncharacterized protein n=1 Tax=Litchfieldia luteola TaxID=682179 RepID=A0ABR9QIF0_9BACI|nr:hypothetical protein [Cytobacillus luteolus]MBE4908265.1 hypothetical protein [Cytobacillus luteolus]MBP1943051.1 septal ring factor EnvC (AmiA/AmiB activator) [Cytobacillus luteolus]